ncbi:hypothetical protein [Oceanobacillus manasiensis]|uniref:hypothetical protein n=1 Tax=Oceanobacillus manasiensis TaxID=586413 RepID=UPI0005A785C6|nr:hypothetical protein [Oceanobacillus manasiensis]
MKEWWKKKKARTRRARKDHNAYTKWDALMDVLFWVPELIILPFRLAFWLIRVVLGRFLDIT